MADRSTLTYTMPRQELMNKLQAAAAYALAYKTAGNNDEASAIAGAGQVLSNMIGVEETRQPDGLHHKFNVSRVDGRDLPGGDREGSRYLVLDLDHDPTARTAAMIYALSLPQHEGMLAFDLLHLLAEIDTRLEGEVHRHEREPTGTDYQRIAYGRYVEVQRARNKAMAARAKARADGRGDPP